MLFILVYYDYKNWEHKKWSGRKCNISWVVYKFSLSLSRINNSVVGKKTTQDA